MLDYIFLISGLAFFICSVAMWIKLSAKLFVATLIFGFIMSVLAPFL